MEPTLMLVTKSARCSTTSTIQVQCRPRPGYEKTRIYEGVVMQVRDKTIVYTNENQQAALIDGALLAPGQSRTVQVPGGEFCPVVWTQIKTYATVSAEVPIDESKIGQPLIKSTTYASPREYIWE